MATTTRLTMTKLAEGQRQKEVTINDALDTLDAIASSDLGEFTLAGIPAAVANPNAYALVTNASGGRTIVRSDGSAWKIVAIEGATVS